MYNKIRKTSFFAISMLGLFFASLLVSCHPANGRKKEKVDESYFYVGTYTGNGSNGIYLYKQRGDSLIRVGLAAKTVNPSFLARSDDGRFLLAVNETHDQGSGSVESYAIRNHRLKFLNRRPSHGDDPCFVSANAQGYVLVSNYNGGNVGLFKLNNDGYLSKLLDMHQDTGTGMTARQQHPHAHQSVFEPGTDRVVTVDLGADALFFFKLDTLQKKLVATFPFALKMSPGDGPRHLAFHPNKKWLYVVSELSSTVTQWIKNADGSYAKGEVVSTLPRNYHKTSYCAEISISPDGRFLYVSNRGHNSIVVFQINRQTGALNRIAFQNVHGNWPRFFTFSPDGNYLVVANKKTNNLVLFKRNKQTGQLFYVSEISAPNPVCILFL